MKEETNEMLKCSDSPTESRHDTLATFSYIAGCLPDIHYPRDKRAFNAPVSNKAHCSKPLPLVAHIHECSAMHASHYDAIAWDLLRYE